MGGGDPSPRGGPHQQEGNGQSDDPAADKEPLPPDPVGKPPRRQVPKGLDEPEPHDERQDDTRGGQPEPPLRDERQDRPLQPHHPSDEGVDQDQERKLGEVLPQPQDRFRNSLLSIRLYDHLLVSGRFLYAHPPPGGIMSCVADPAAAFSARAHTDRDYSRPDSPPFYKSSQRDVIAFMTWCGKLQPRGETCSLPAGRFSRSICSFVLRM